MIANGSSSIPGKMNGQGTYKYNWMDTGQEVIVEVTTQYRAVETEQDWIGDKEDDQMEWFREECLDLSG